MYLYLHWINVPYVYVYIYTGIHAFTYISIHIHVYICTFGYFTQIIQLGPFPQALQGHVDKKTSELMALNKENGEQAKLGQGDLVFQTWQWSFNGDLMVI